MGTTWTWKNGTWVPTQVASVPPAPLLPFMITQANEGDVLVYQAGQWQSKSMLDGGQF